MKNAYPVVFTPYPEGGYMAYVPDFDINTEGISFADAIYMARDAIGLVGITLEDEGKSIPVPSSLDSVHKEADDLISFVDVDFAEYRRQTERRAVRKNVTIPSWLNSAAEEAGLNFSALLSDAIRNKLGLTDR